MLELYVAGILKFNVVHFFWNSCVPTVLSLMRNAVSPYWAIKQVIPRIVNLACQEFEPDVIPILIIYVLLLRVTATWSNTSKYVLPFK